MYLKFVNAKEILIVFICMYSISFLLEMTDLFLFYRHVQVNNETALSFYKKFGFQVISTAVEYYRRLEPSDAYLLERSLKKTATNEHGSNVQQSTKKNSSVPLSTITDVD